MGERRLVGLDDLLFVALRAPSWPGAAFLEAGVSVLKSLHGTKDAYATLPLHKRQ